MKIEGLKEIIVWRSNSNGWYHDSEKEEGDE